MPAVLRSLKEAVPLALAAVLLLSDCGGSTKAEPEPAPSSPAQSSTQPAASSSSDEPLSLDFAADSAPLESSTSTVVAATTGYKQVQLHGVDEPTGKKFAEEYQQLVQEELDYLAQRASEYQPAPAEYCQPAPEGKCGQQLEVSVTESGIFEHYATVSMAIRYNIVGGTSTELSRSLTMDVDAGELAEAKDFLPSLDAIVEHAQDGTCLSSLTASSLAGDPEPVQAFSPTEQGLYLSWDSGRHDITACGLSSLLLDWDGLYAAASATATADAAPSAAGAAQCAGGYQPPAGTDGRLCSPAPASARPAEVDSPVIMAPSGDMWCAIYEDFADCSAMSGTPFRAELPLAGAAFEPNVDDGPPGEGFINPEPGEVVTSGAFACLVAEDSLACWSTQSGHGVLMSPQRRERW